MKAATERKIIRWAHILLSIPLVGYIYGPLASLKYPAMAVKFVFLPVIVLSGFWLWKGHLLKKRFRRSSKQGSGKKQTANGQTVTMSRDKIQ